MDALPETCQYLGTDHVRETDVWVLRIHLETLFLLSTRGGVRGARLVREMGAYPVVRELHLDVEDEGVRRGCERLVDVLMGDEAVGGSHEGGEARGDGGVRGVGRGRHEDGGGGVGTMVTEERNGNRGAGTMVTQVVDDEDEDDDDDEIAPIF